MNNLQGYDVRFEVSLAVLVAPKKDSNNFLYFHERMSSVLY